MTTRDRLLPCPFCSDGGDPAIKIGTHAPHSHYAVKTVYTGICQKCGASEGGKWITETLATKAWNRRARSAQEPAERKVTQTPMMKRAEFAESRVAELEAGLSNLQRLLSYGNLHGGDDKPADCRQCQAVDTIRALLAREPHPHTDECGFDRQSSIQEDRYVCMCGYRNPDPAPPGAAVANSNDGEFGMPLEHRDTAASFEERRITIRRVHDAPMPIKTNRVRYRRKSDRPENNTAAPSGETNTATQVLDADDATLQDYADALRTDAEAQRREITRLSAELAGEAPTSSERMALERAKKAEAELAKWQRPFDQKQFDIIQVQVVRGDTLAAQKVYITALEHALKHKDVALAAANERLAEAEKRAYPFGCSLDEMDVEAFLNVRTWLKDALESKGATFDGGGIGMGRADIDITLEGHRYNVAIRPLPERAGIDAAKERKT